MNLLEEHVQTTTKDGEAVSLGIASTVDEFSAYVAIVESKGNMCTEHLHELNPLNTGNWYNPLVIAKNAQGEVIAGTGLVRQGARVYMDSFIVDEAWRNRGIGSAMAEFAAEECVSPEETLVAIVAAYVGIQKKKFEGMGFKILPKGEAERLSIPYKEDEYAQQRKNRGCSVFLYEKNS